MAARLRALSGFLAATLGLALFAACSLSLDGYAGPPETEDASDATTAPADATMGLPVDASVDVADAASAYATMVLADQPTLYFRLGESVGAAGAKDLVTGRSGPFRGIPLLGVPGAIVNDNDTGMRLDGTNGMVLSGVGRFAGNVPYTLEAWARPTDVGTANGGHVVLAAESGGTDGYSIYFYQTDHPALEREYEGGVDTAYSAGMEAPATAYSHLVGTYDGTNQRLYVNGQLQATFASPSAIPGGHTVPFAIGGNDQASSNTFIGDVDEVAIYDHVLPDGTILLHYQVGMGKTP